MLYLEQKLLTIAILLVDHLTFGTLPFYASHELSSALNTKRDDGTTELAKDVLCARYRLGARFACIYCYLIFIVTVSSGFPCYESHYS